MHATLPPHAVRSPLMHPGFSHTHAITPKRWRARGAGLLCAGLWLLALGAHADTPAPAPAPAPLPVAAATPAPAPPLASDEPEFDLGFFTHSPGAALYLKKLLSTAGAAPGRYRADLFLNNQKMGTFDLELVARPNQSAQACFNVDVVRRFNVKPDYFTQAAAQFIQDQDTRVARLQAGQPVSPQTCLTFDQLFKGGSFAFDSSKLRADVTVPQAYLDFTSDNDMRSKWDSGVPAGALNYDFNTYSSQSNSYSSKSNYLGLTTRLHVGGWVVQQRGAINQYNNGLGTVNNGYQKTMLSASTDVPAWNSSLTVGNTYSDGSLLDSVSLSGVTLGTDMRMLPASARSLTPVIRGEAQGNANVEVWQFGKMIYNTTMPPGPFVLRDINALGFGGDLLVIIKEANGSQRSFTVPNSAPVSMLTEGTWSYNLAAGQQLNTGNPHPLLQSTLRYGASSLYTLNAAVQLADHYAQVLVGSAMNTRLGAIGANLSHSVLKLPSLGSSQGNRISLSWSAAPQGTNTQYNIVSYRYSTKNFYGVSDGMGRLDSTQQGLLDDTQVRAKYTTTVSVSKQFAGWGSVYASGTQRANWNQSGIDTSLQVGLSKPIGRASLSVSLSRTKTNYTNVYNVLGTLPNTTANSVGVMVSFPLEITPQHKANVGLSLLKNPDGSTAFQENFSTALGEHNALGLGASLRQSASQSYQSVNMNYASTYASMYGSLSSGSGNLQHSLGASGAVVLHAGGLTLAPSVSETFGIVKVEGGSGAKVANTQAAPIDSRGYTVVPYLTPYTSTPLRLDLSDIDLDIDIDNNSQAVVPRAGAVVQATFARRPGRMVLINGRLDNGKPLPFAAQVLDEQQTEVGLVGQGGQAQARLLKASGVLYVRWGAAGENSCIMPYTLPQPTPAANSAQAGANTGSPPRNAPATSALTRLQGVCVAQAPRPPNTDTDTDTAGSPPVPSPTPITQQTPATPPTTTGQGPTPPLATTRTRAPDSVQPPPLRSGLGNTLPLHL